MFVLYLVLCGLVFVFFKQKTAYEMRISDWSSDVCSSDLYPQSTNLGYPFPPPKGGLEPRRRNGNSGIPFPVVLQERPPDHADDRAIPYREIGRASCRERVCQYV